MLDHTIIEQNTAHVPPATSDMSAAQIEETARKASANVQAVQSEEGRLSSGANGAALLIEAAVETFVPGAKIITGAAEIASQRHTDNYEAKHSGKPVSIDDHIVGSFRKTTAAGLISSVNNVCDSLLNSTGTDKFGTSQLTGGLKNGNSSNIPTDQKAASQLTRSIESVISVKQTHKQALDSVPVAQANLGAARAKAMQMAPGMSLGNGPSFNANQIMQEADRYREEQRGSA